MNTADYLLEAGSDEQAAVLVGTLSYSYRELRLAVDDAAEGLKRQGIEPTDRVGLISANSLFWVVSYLAILKVGAVAVPLPMTITPIELTARQAFIRCKTYCVSRQLYGRLRSALPPIEGLFFEDSFYRINAPGRHGSSSATVTPDQDAVFLFTSGTTAESKVVRLTHRNIQANTSAIVEYLSLGSSDRAMVVLPFSYCFGCSLLHTHLRVGGSLVLARFLYPESLLDQLETTACTNIAGVPSVYQTLLRNTSFATRQLPALKKIQQAGGKLPDAMLNELVVAAPGAEVFVMYGQTEATARLSYLLPSMLGKKLGSIGRGIPGVHLEIIDNEGNPVAPGQVGEIVAHGDNISPGYLDNPRETALKFRKGALHTGDLARMDEEGFIYIVDRKADFIKSFGHRVSSQEVESAVLEIKDVVSAAAIGVPDLLRGEAIYLYLTLRSDSTATPETVIDYCKRRLPSHAVPRDIEILGALPLSENGKVLKGALRQRAMSQSASTRHHADAV